MLSKGQAPWTEQQLATEQQYPHPHPLLSAISGHNYAQTQRVHYPYQHYYQQQQQQQPHYHYHHGRPLIAAGSSYNSAYASPHSGYGSIEPSVEYEIQDTPPSGSYSSYHPSAGSAPAYPPPHHHHHHQPPSPPHKPKSSSSSSGKSKTKKGSGSVMSALTLLSFFFFVNMLQNCIKDHMADMNPTVMVLTASGSRNRFNKLAEMNSREQTSSPASTTASAAQSEAAASSWQHHQQSAVSSGPVIVTPTVVLQSPYSSGLVTNKPAVHHHHKPPLPAQSYGPHTQHYQQYNDDDYNYGHRTPAPQTAPYSYSADFYPNRTHIDQYQSPRPTSHSNSNSNSDYYQHHYYPDRHHYTDAGYDSGGFDSDSDSDSGSISSYGHRHHPWSYGANSHAGNQQRYSSAPWSSASLGAQSGVSSYLDNVRSRRQGDDDDDD
ncbi:uncharacterized protein Dwil_GK14244, partial [Drosophila willistoni]